MKEKESNLALPSTKKDLLRGKDYVKNNNKSPRQNKQQRRKKKKKLLTVRAICRGGLSQVGQILGRFDRASRSEAYLSLRS